MKNILILEDNLEFRKGIEKIISEIDSSITVFSTEYSEEALNIAKNNNIDLFLLDIEVKGYSGIELGLKIREIDRYVLTPMIFITAIPTEELNAFKSTHCYEYILKPIDYEKLKELLERIINAGRFEEERELKIKKKYFIKTIKEKDIVYIESFGKDLEIVTEEERIEAKNFRMNKIIEELSDDFAYAHRSYIVNLKRIEEIDRTNDELILRGTDKYIPVGGKYKKNIVRYLGK